MPNRVGWLLPFTHYSASCQFIQRPSWKGIEKNLSWIEGFYSHTETMTLVLYTWCHYFSVPSLLECRIFTYANKFYFVLGNNLKMDLNVLEYNNNEGIQIKNRLGNKVGFLHKYTTLEIFKQANVLLFIFWFLYNKVLNLHSKTQECIKLSIPEYLNTRSSYSKSFLKRHYSSYLSSACKYGSHSIS